MLIKQDSNQKYEWLLSVAGGLLASLAWWDKASGMIILVAFVPFIFLFRSLINRNYNSPSTSFLKILPGFIVFNIITFSWIRNASIAGAVYAVLINSTLMTAVFAMGIQIARKSNSYLAYTSLIGLWLAFEYLSTRINILSPWLLLGNTLGNEPYLIQWYDITGSAGGSLWIWLCNLLIFHMLKGDLKKNAKAILLIMIFIFPVSGSLIKYLRPLNISGHTSVLIIQPNIDPYNDKFSNISFTDQLNQLLEDARNQLDHGTDWLIFPETVVDDPFYEENALRNKYVGMCYSLVSQHPGMDLITGMTTMRSYMEGIEDIPKTAMRIDTGKLYYEIYNSAVHLTPEGDISFYHKSKLVPGIELRINALPGIISDRIIPDLGGTMSGYGTQSYREVFFHSKDSVAAAPVICYESAYGEFVSQYTRAGADFISILTNDGWWQNTAGYKQHLMFARIRAIENRRSVARAANTGISCLIDPKGNITHSLGWWERNQISGDLPIVSHTTFYNRYGDFIYRFAFAFSIFVIVIAFIAVPVRKIAGK